MDAGRGVRFDAARRRAEEDHPVGAIRYHGDPRRGEAHCRVEVTGHHRGGRVSYRRVGSGGRGYTYANLCLRFEELPRVVPVLTARFGRGRGRGAIDVA